MLHLRAIEWTNWPTFLSPLFVPILLTIMLWWSVLIALVATELLWCLLRYRLHDLRTANSLAVWVSLGQWPIALVSFVVLLFERRFGVSVLALVWPLVHGFISIPGKIGVVEANFARELGYIGSEDVVG
jgi:hypothetical protein